MKSLRLRLALISAAISGIVIVAFGMTGWMLTVHLLQESIDLRLEVSLDRIVRDLHPRTDFDRVVANVEIGFGDDVTDGKRRIILFDRDGSEIYRAPEGEWASEIDSAIFEINASVADADMRRPEEGRRPPPPPRPKPGGIGPGDRSPPLGPPGARLDERRGPPPMEGGARELIFYTFSDDGKRWRAGVIENRGYVVFMATDLSEHQDEVSRIRYLFFLALPICLLTIGLGGWFVARRALRPVDLIAKTASRVTAQGLDKRIPEGVHDYEELSNLVDVFNGMIDRLEGSFRQAIRFSADASHELKTPLAVMQVAVQDALKQCEPGSKEEECLLTVSYEADRLKRITRSLMLLAQAESGQLSIKRDTFSLSREVEAVCEDAEILCDKADLTFKSDIENDIEVDTDTVLLRQAMQNLVSNAVKYNQSGGAVACRLYRFEESSEIVFEVANTGKGIKEEEQKKIFERFYRADRSRSRIIDGFGLGLNLAWEIVNAMGGELLLVESNDKITRFQVRLKERKVNS